MEDQSVSRVGTSSIKQESHASDVPKEENANVWIPADSWQRRIHRVAPHLREDKGQLIYDPMVVSLGPYHHGQPHLSRVEQFKDEMLNTFVSDNVTQDKGFFRGKILGRIDQIRSYYEGVEYNDEELAEMMLRDACFLVYSMQMRLGVEKHMRNRLGLSTYVFLFRDTFKLENQIPLWVVRLLLDLRFGDGEGEALLREFLSITLFGNVSRLTALPWQSDKEHEPLHLLEAYRAMILRQETATEGNKPGGFLLRIFRWMKGCRRDNNSTPSETIDELLTLPFRSVTYLQSKGIYFRPSSKCLTDIRFTSYCSFGILHVPIMYASDDTKAFFSNTIAFEMSPESATDGAVTSYVNFMKSLVQNPKDVEELRGRGIICSRMGTDEEVVRVLKEIRTYEADNWSTFYDVKKRIEEHCNSKAKTWMAQLVLTYFRSPWTAIALFAAAFLLCLTFLQTYYTIRPAK